VFDLATLRDFILTMRIVPPTIDISVVGYNKGIERHSCPMASAKKSVTRCILDRQRRTNVFARRNLLDIGPSMLTSMKKGRLVNISIVCSVRKS